jgi:hypothetical protein
MGFFNKKEEVIEIQLTSYGKELYSKGKFTPVYYSFFDEGILYDGARANITETQNNVQHRIKNLTPQLKDVKEHISPGNLVAEGQIVPKESYAREISLFDFDSTYENQLGISKNNSDFAPSWRIRALQSEFTSSTSFLTASSTSRGLPIPQINLNDDSITYETKIMNSLTGRFDNDPECGSIEDMAVPAYGEFPDGSFISVDENYILLKIKESNTTNLRDNFEFEIFEIKERKKNQVASTKTLKPLKFFNFQSQVQNGILMDEGFGEEDFENLDRIDDTFASHYLEIFVDQEVDQDTLCKLDPERKEDTIFIKDFVSCEDIKKEKTDIYGEMDDSNMEDFFDEECE